VDSRDVVDRGADPSDRLVECFQWEAGILVHKAGPIDNRVEPGTGADIFQKVSFGEEINATVTQVETRLEIREMERNQGPVEAKTLKKKQWTRR
jgi:hypothetical protein